MKPILLIFLPSAGVLAGWFLRPALQPAAVLSPGAAEAGLPGGGIIQPAPAANNMGAAATPALVKPEILPLINAGDPKAAIKSLLSFSRSGKNPLRTQARLLAFADQLSPADLKALALEASNQPSNYWGGDSKVKDILLGTWAEVSPKEALAFVMGPSSPATREALPAVFSQLAITDLKGAEAALGALGEGRKNAALRAMAVRVAQDRPEMAIALLDRQKARLGDFSYYSVFSIWSRQDPSGAAAYAGSLPDGQKRSQALGNIAEGMAQDDPVAALAWAKSLPRASESLNLVRTVISSLAERDPETALSLAQQQPLREQRALLVGIASKWMWSDSVGAVAWIKTMEDNPTRQECLSNMALNADYCGVGENLETLMSLLPKGKMRNDALRNVSRSLGWTDAEGTLAWARTLPQEDQDLVIGQLSAGIAAADPEKAAELAAALPPSAASVQAAVRVASQWAEKNPQEAIAWAATLDSEKARQDATAAALAQWADRDPEKAAGATGQIADENARRTAREKIAATWAEKSPAEAEKWAASLPEADRYSALASVWNATATDDPGKAAASLAAALPGAEGIESATSGLAASASTIATAWVSQNPNAAADWATRLPEGKAREAAMGAVADQWAGTDTMAASTWINQLPQGRSRDEAAAKLIEKITPTDPAAAFTWAANIQDPDRQLQSLKSTINAWKVYNPSAVRDTLANSSLDEATVAKLNAELK
jgi:hypothetical protein